MIAQTVRNIMSIAFVITVLGAFSACSTTPPGNTPTAKSRPLVSTPVPPATKPFGQRAAAVALDQIGVPYRYGGTDRRGFDCSGLVQYSYDQVGKRLPRTTGQLWSSSSTVPRSELEAGDLLFFRVEGKMQHVGLYIGAQQFVHAPSSGRTVSIATLSSPYYASAFLRAARPD